MYADAVVPQRTVHLLILQTPDFSLQRNTTAQKKEEIKNPLLQFVLFKLHWKGGGVKLPQPEWATPFFFQLLF